MIYVSGSAGVPRPHLNKSGQDVRTPVCKILVVTAQYLTPSKMLG